MYSIATVSIGEELPMKYWSSSKFISTLNLNDASPSQDVINKIQKINLFLEVAESNTRLGNFYEAQQLLFKAQAYTSKLKGCKSCV